MITILHTGQTGVERGADRAARAAGFEVRGFCQRDLRDELGVIPPHIAADLTPLTKRGARAAWEPTLEASNVLVVAVPDRDAAADSAGIAALRRLARKKHVPHVVVDPNEDLDAVARDLRAREARAARLAIMVSGPRRTRWADGENIGWQLVTRLTVASRYSRRVLVVDDDSDTATSLCRAVSLLGHECVFATSGREALARAGALRPDVGLFDIRLPDLSGYELARRLRASQPGPLFLAAITGWNDDTGGRAALDAGFDRHVIKPVGVDLIQGLLESANEQLGAANACAS